MLCDNDKTRHVQTDGGKDYHHITCFMREACQLKRSGIEASTGPHLQEIKIPDGVELR